MIQFNFLMRDGVGGNCRNWAANVQNYLQNNMVRIIQSEHRIQSHDFVYTNQSLVSTLGRIYSNDLTIIETDTLIFSPCSGWVGGGVQIVTTSLDNV